MDIMILNIETGEANITTDNEHTMTDEETFSVAKEATKNPDILLYSNNNRNSRYDFVTEFLDDFNTIDFIDRDVVYYKFA